MMRVERRQSKNYWISFKPIINSILNTHINIVCANILILAMILMIIGEIKYLTDKITKDSGVKTAIFFYFIIIVMLVIKISLPSII